jgi:hypothetical protein
MTTARRPRPHHCHARGCEIITPPRLLMCRRHWYMAPSPLRAAVWSAFRPGQEIDKAPSRRWVEAAGAAAAYVAEREGRRRLRIEVGSVPS